MTHSNPPIPPHVKDPGSPSAFPDEPSAAATIPPAPAGPHAVANDSEEVYYAGSPLLRGELGRGFLWIIIGLILLAGPFIYHALTNPASSHRWLPWWLNLGFIVLGLIFAFIPYIKAKSIRYRITNYRIDVSHGVLGTNIDTVELWHVEDIRFHQSLLSKIVGIGDITILSKHPTIPVLEMRSLPRSRQLFTELEQRIISVKRLSGVVKVDPGT